MPSYPGTVKVFSTKVDNTDTVFAEHINTLQDEVIAIQQILGVNPNGPLTTVAARLTAVESLAGLTTVPGNKVYSGTSTYTSTVRLDNASTLTAVGGTGHPLQVGTTAARNLAVDGQRIQGRNAGAPGDILLQPYGGDVYVGSGKVWTSTNDGTGSGLDADMLDGHETTYFATATHQHAANFTVLYRNTNQSIPSGTWTTVAFTAISRDVYESGTLLHDANDPYDTFFTPSAVGPALYYLGFRASFAASNAGVTRGVRIIDSNDAIIDQELESADFSTKDWVSNSGLYYFSGTSGYYVRVQVYQDSGSTLQLAANTTTRPFKLTWAAVVRQNG